MRIGLTGGIGSGKSTVANVWVSLGAGLVATDAIARALTAPGGAAMPAILARFGACMEAPDGSLNRAAMRALAFGSDAAREALEGILHPLIQREAERQAEQAQARFGTVLLDIPLLTESGRWRRAVDRVVVVDCPAETQITRVRARSGWDEATVRSVIARQAGRCARRAIADAVIYNDGTDPTVLAAEVEALDRTWRVP